MQAPLTPHELRTKRRDAQSLVRRAFNELNAGLDAWKKAHESGLTAATATSNAYLSKWYLPALPLGVLADLPDLRETAAAKLQAQAERHLDGVEAAVDACASAAQQLRLAADSLAAPGLDSGQAVFACLSLPLIEQEVHKVAAAHEAELELKTAVLSSLDSAIGDDVAPRKGSIAEQESKRRDHMQVLLTTWMLQPKIDEAIVEGLIDTLAVEMKGF